MPVYSCKIGTADGKILEREFEAQDPGSLKESLEDQGFFVFAVRKRPLQFLLDKGPGRKRVSTAELLSLNQEMLVLLKAGLPIIQILDTILERMEKGRLSQILIEIRSEISGGKSLSDAFAMHPGIFPHLYIASVKAGEKTGDLPLTIRRFNEYLKRTTALRKKFIDALIYPAIIATVAAVAVSVLLVYVVPTFTQVYTESGSQLPLATRILIGFTTFLKKYILLVLAAGTALIFALRKWAATEPGRFFFDALKLRLPVIGDVVAKYSLAGFTRTIGTVIGSGIPIVESLRMSVGTLNNVILERKLLEAVLRVEEGTRLSSALERVNIMPPIALRMISVGETIGSLEEMLLEISEYFEEEIERRLHVLTTAIEPAIMIVMGLFIGAIIITMYLPVFKIAGTLG